MYPVPDGDTGTNMLHTMKTALEHARKAEPQAAAVLAGATHGALMGARGLWLLIDGALAALEGRFAPGPVARAAGARGAALDQGSHEVASWAGAVSYTHLTLPTKRIV